MPASFSIPCPTDFDLKRDCCSYGYFLLYPNHWDINTHALTRPLHVATGPALVRITQPKGPGTPLAIAASRPLTTPDAAEARRQITRMLRLDEPADVIRAFHKVDPRWKRSGRGRLFRSPTFFEDVAKTVTSCNIQWPGTIQMNRRLCEVLGEPVPFARVRGLKSVPAHAEFHTFPSPETLASARPATLRARCRTGYRDQRLVEIARLFALGRIDPAWFESPDTSDDDVHDALLDLPGIGPYAAANIMQLLGRFRRLPLDTESVRHARTLLGYTGSPKSIMKKLKSHYEPFGEHAFRSYWLELWRFYESKQGPAWTWERDTTGRVFTAALLNA